MSHLVQYVQWAWGISFAIQALVCGLLLFRGHFRKIPLFTTFVAANACQWVLLYAIYKHYGIGSRTTLVLAWSSEACILLLRTLATMEVLHRVLGHYRGIWVLSWRVLAVSFGIVLTYATIEGGRNVSSAIMLADRGFHLAFAVALVACLALVRHYAIPTSFVYKGLLGGFCFYSCAVVLANTVEHVVFLHKSAAFQPIWQAAIVVAYGVVQIVWVVALRKPLPAEEKQRAHLPISIYQEMSPEINQRLRLLNKQVVELWKPEVTRQ